MNAANKRLALLAGTILAAHVFAIFALQSRDPILARVVNNGFARIPMPQSDAYPPAKDDGLNDPLIFAGAHPRGFSAPVWLTPPPQVYAISNPAPPPQFLAYTRPALEIPAANPIRSPGSTLPFLTFSLPTNSPSSILTIEGDISARAPANLPALPIQFATEVLSNTVVQVGIRADGFPFSLRIVSGSGSRAADLSALDIANRIRFARSQNTNSLEWGNLEFQWFTTDPPTTNAPPPTTALARPPR